MRALAEVVAELRRLDRALLGTAIENHIELCSSCTDAAMCTVADDLRSLRNALPRLLEAVDAGQACAEALALRVRGHELEHDDDCFSCRDLRTLAAARAAGLMPNDSEQPKSSAKEQP